MSALNIMQCLRAPVGGLFRHVCDLSRMLADAGHNVGIVCDASTGGTRANRVLKDLEQHCALGIHRIAMSRTPGLRDLKVMRSVKEIAEKWQVDVMHGHGAKGGAYVRLSAPKMIKESARVYTPHGGSLHYSPKSPAGLIFLGLEKFLVSRTDGMIFESQFAKNTFESRIGRLKCNSRVVHNGLNESDFNPIQHATNPTNILFVGELRELKGVGILLNAIRLLNDQGHKLTATIVGSGPEGHEFQDQAKNLGLAAQIKFPGRLPAHEAFGMGEILVVPSLNESFPYIVLEAGAAGMPVVATSVGGIPEIFGDRSSNLVEPGNPEALADAILRSLKDDQLREKTANDLRQRIRENFTARHMGGQILEFYRTISVND